MTTEQATLMESAAQSELDDYGRGSGENDPDPPEAVEDTPELPGGFEYRGVWEGPQVSSDSPEPTGPLWYWSRDSYRLGIYRQDEYEGDGFVWAVARHINPVDGGRYWTHTHIAETAPQALESARREADFRVFSVESDTSETWREWRERTGGTGYEPPEVPWELEEWPPYEDHGPTADRPAPEWIYGQEWTRRRAIAHGIDWDGWAEAASHGGLPDYHIDDAERPNHRELWAENAARFGSR
jgi:hypothetical protein